MHKTAVVLFNLGGPDGLGAVRPFLFNLFNDPAIIDKPGPLRWLLAQLISRRRAPIARQIYRELGGGSPLLANTRAQADALEAALNAGGGDGETKVFIAMRYWHPMSDETARAVMTYGPDQVVLLPLYPQFSTTTTGSSIADWARAAAKAGLTAPTRSLCCYPTQPGFVAEIAGLLRAGLAEAEAPAEALAKGGALAEGGNGARVLFSAHGLPKKFIEGGDPYQWQVEQTAAAVAAALNQPGLDWTICYQSRVGPLEWIGPATDAEIVRAGKQGKALVVVPVAFVSEHSETLVELDIEYRRLAERNGVPHYIRVATVGTGAAFIEGLAELLRAALAGERACCSQDGGRLCPRAWGGCPQARRE
jgi:ferrochelatase